MKIYHMIIEKLPPFSYPEKDMSDTRREYMNTKQGHVPQGWRCVGVCGYHETAKKEDARK